MKNRLWLLLFLLLPYAGFQQPVGYYNGTEGLQSDALKDRLHEIIRGHSSLSYNFSKYVLYSSDADPMIPGNVILVYTGRSQDGMDYGVGGNFLNREHVWARSHGDFSGRLPMDSDVHNLKPADATANNARSNLDFDWSEISHPAAPECKYTPGVSWEPRDVVKGDIARMIFYMDTRYGGFDGEINLTMVDEVKTSPLPEHGKKSALLQWSRTDQPDQFERNRNDVIFRFQKNRNPFIDNPQFVELIWGYASLPEFTISNIHISEQQPQNDEPVTIFCTIEPAPTQGSVRLMYGDAHNNLTDSVVMTFENNLWRGIIPPHAEESIIYNVIHVDHADAGFTRSPLYNYRVAGSFEGNLTPIPDIQGSGDISPYVGQEVSIAGTVTAFLVDGFFVQQGQGKRTAVYISDPWRFPAIGDSVVVTGVVAESFGLTQIESLSFYKLIKTDRRIPEPAFISAEETSEDWESVLVRIPNATCTFADHWNNFGMWVVNDGTGNVNIQNNDVFSITPSLDKDYSLTGVLNYTFSEWKIELRFLQDIADPTSIDDDRKMTSFTVFPNPTSGSIFFEIPENSGFNPEMRIFDLMGIEVFSRKNLSGNPTVHLDLKKTNLNSGVYLLVFKDEHIAITERIIFYSY
jgi:endonuclease I